MITIQNPEFGFNYQVSSLTNTSTSSGSFASLITLSGLVVSGAFPVKIEVQGSVFAESAGASISVEFALFRDGTQIKGFTLKSNDLAGGLNRIEVPAGISFMDIGITNATYVYSLKGRVLVAASCGVVDCSLIAYELAHT